MKEWTGKGDGNVWIYMEIQIEERKHIVDIEICTETNTLHGLALSYIECQKDRDRQWRVRSAVVSRGFQHVYYFELKRIALCNC